MTECKRARLHRFRDMIAIRFGEGETVYLRPGDAQRIADAIGAMRSDMRESKQIGTIELEFTKGTT